MSRCGAWRTSPRRCEARGSRRSRNGETAPIEGDHPYLYLDGIVMKRTWAGEVRNVSLPVASAVNSEGYRHLRRRQGGQVRLVGVLRHRPRLERRATDCQCRRKFPQKCRSKIPELCRRGRHGVMAIFRRPVPLGGGVKAGGVISAFERTCSGMSSAC